MIKYINFFVSLLLIGFLSCKEENNDESVNYPIIYTGVPIIENCFKVFTKNGEITDSITVNKLIDKYGISLAGMSKDIFKENVILIYLSPESVELSMSESGNIDTLIVHNKPKLIYWEDKDTTCQALGSVMGDSFINILFMHKPLYYEEFEIPNSSGYAMAVKYKRCYYVNRVGEHFVLPMLDFLYKHDDFFCSYGVAVNNVFKRESMSNFDTNDTLIIKEYSLIFEK